MDGGRCGATLRTGALCPHGCVIARLCIDIHLPHSSLPCGQTAGGAATWHGANRSWFAVRAALLSRVRLVHTWPIAGTVSSHGNLERQTGTGRRRAGRLVRRSARLGAHTPRFQGGPVVREPERRLVLRAAAGGRARDAAELHERRAE